MKNTPKLILFVDIDGVLNTKDHQRRRVRSGKKADKHYWCPTAVAHLNVLTEKLGAKIVVTSTWKYEYDLETLRDYFQKNGVNSKHVIGHTPTLIWDQESASRGDEIQTWIDEHEAQNDLHIILDDQDHGISDQFDHLIRCNEQQGFAERARIEECLDIIKEAGTI